MRPLAPAREHGLHLDLQEGEELGGLGQPPARGRVGADRLDAFADRFLPARQQRFTPDDRLVPEVAVQGVDVAP